jgi:SnoaL-like domain
MTRLDALEARLAQLEAEREIVRTLHSYGHAIDYGREAAFADCFTDDAVLRWPGSEPEWMLGVDAIVAAFRRHTHAPQRYHKHFLAEPLVVVEGERARVESMFARLDPYETVPKICAFGRYLDEFVACRDGRWRLSRRLAEIEAWRHGAPPVPTPEPGSARVEDTRFRQAR